MMINPTNPHHTKHADTNCLGWLALNSVKPCGRLIRFWLLLGAILIFVHNSAQAITYSSNPAVGTYKNVGAGYRVRVSAINGSNVSFEVMPKTVGGAFGSVGTALIRIGSKNGTTVGTGVQYNVGATTAGVIVVDMQAANVNLLAGNADFYVVRRDSAGLVDVNAWDGPITITSTNQAPTTSLTATMLGDGRLQVTVTANDDITNSLGSDLYISNTGNLATFNFASKKTTANLTRGVAATFYYSAAELAAVCSAGNTYRVRSNVFDASGLEGIGYSANFTYNPNQAPTTSLTATMLGDGRLQVTVTANDDITNSLGSDLYISNTGNLATFNFASKKTTANLTRGVAATFYYSAAELAAVCSAGNTYRVRSNVFDGSGLEGIGYSGNFTYNPDQAPTTSLTATMLGDGRLQVTVTANDDITNLLGSDLYISNTGNLATFNFASKKTTANLTRGVAATFYYSAAELAAVCSAGNTYRVRSNVFDGSGLEGIGYSGNFNYVANQAPTLSTASATLLNDGRLEVRVNANDDTSASLGCDVYLSNTGNLNAFNFASKKSIGPLSRGVEKVAYYSAAELAAVCVIGNAYRPRANVYDGSVPQGEGIGFTSNFNYITVNGRPVISAVSASALPDRRVRVVFTATDPENDAMNAALALRASDGITIVPNSVMPRRQVSLGSNTLYYTQAELGLMTTLVTGQFQARIRLYDGNHNTDSTAAESFSPAFTYTRSVGGAPTMTIPIVTVLTDGSLRLITLPSDDAAGNLALTVYSSLTGDTSLFNTAAPLRVSAPAGVQLTYEIPSIWARQAGMIGGSQYRLRVEAQDATGQTGVGVSANFTYSGPVTTNNPPEFKVLNVTGAAAGTSALELKLADDSTTTLGIDLYLFETYSGVETYVTGSRQILSLQTGQLHRLSFSADGIVSGKTYRWRANAFDASGAESSAFTPPFSVASPPPATGQGFSADPNDVWRSFDAGSSPTVTPQLRGGNATHSLTPAEIIYYAARENDINPVLLLAKIQHEKSLIEQPFSDDSTLTNALLGATGYNYRDSGTVRSHLGFYPQTVSCTYQFSRFRAQGLTFSAAFAKYTTSRAGWDLFRNSIYPKYVREMNAIAGTSFAEEPTGGTPAGLGYYSDFLQNVTVQHVQAFLERYSGRLKSRNLFYTVAGRTDPPLLVLSRCLAEAPAIDDYPWRELAQDYSRVMTSDGSVIPIRSACAGDTSNGFCNRECVAFVAWRMNRDRGSSSAGPFTFLKRMKGVTLGHAKDWKNQLTAMGFSADNTPAPGAIAQWTQRTYKPYGHVAYVRKVNGDGTIELEEYNFKVTTEPGTYGTRKITASSVENFIHVNEGVGVVPTPMPLAPADGQYLEESVRFQWYPVACPGAVYRIQASTSMDGWTKETGFPAGTARLLDFPPAGQSLTATDYTLPSAEPGQTIYWSVRCAAPGLPTSFYSPPRDVKIRQAAYFSPQPVTPLADADVTIAPNGFAARWDAESDATAFRWQLAAEGTAFTKADGFASPLVNEATVQMSAFYAGALPVGRYSWTVRAEGARPQSDYADPISFTVRPDAPSIDPYGTGAPGISWRTDDYAVASGGAGRNARSSGTSATGNGFRLQILNLQDPLLASTLWSDVDGFAPTEGISDATVPVVSTTGAGSTSFALPDLPAGSYLATVQCIGSSGLDSRWGVPLWFSIGRADATIENIRSLSLFEDGGIPTLLLELPSVSGGVYQVQHSNDLLNWTDIGSSLLGNGLPLVIDAGVNSALPNSFWRVRRR